MQPWLSQHYVLGLPFDFSVRAKYMPLFFHWNQDDLKLLRFGRMITYIDAETLQIAEEWKCPLLKSQKEQFASWLNVIKFIFLYYFVCDTDIWTAIWNLNFCLLQQPFWITSPHLSLVHYIFTDSETMIYHSLYILHTFCWLAYSNGAHRAFFVLLRCEWFGVRGRDILGWNSLYKKCSIFLSQIEHFHIYKVSGVWPWVKWDTIQDPV